MVLKLVMPRIDRMIKGGSVTKWLKAEGEWIHYGEELCEIEIDTIHVVRFIEPEPAQAQIKRLLGATRPRRTEAPTREDIPLPPGFLVRLTSSDTGMMRRIYAKEGMHRDVGDLLALLTTEDNEPIDDPGRAVTRTSMFRVVANISEA